MRILKPAAATIAALSLAACSGFGIVSSENTEYKRASTLPPLEVPPELTAPTTRSDGLPSLGELAAEESGIRAGQGVLPEKANVRILGREDERWLEVDAAPDEAWGAIRGFWTANGFELKVEEPSIGIMETQWVERRPDVPESFLRGFISRVFENAYSVPNREKFRTRLERTDAGTTEVYITHYGVEQVIQEGRAGNTEQAVWQRRPSDPELSNEMLNRMLVHLGVDADRAQTLAAAKEQPRAELRHEGEVPVLVVRDAFARAWRRTGLALDRIGFVVEDRNRSEGIYYVRYASQLADTGGKEEGWFSWLFSSDDDEIAVEGQKAEVRVEAAGADASRIRLRNAEGGPSDPAQAEAVMKRLAQQLR